MMYKCINRAVQINFSAIVSEQLHWFMPVHGTYCKVLPDLLHGGGGGGQGGTD